MIQRIEQVAIVTKERTEATYVVGDRGVEKIKEELQYDGSNGLVELKHHYISVLGENDYLIAHFDALQVPCVRVYFKPTKEDMEEEERRKSEWEEIMSLYSSSNDSK